MTQRTHKTEYELEQPDNLVQMFDQATRRWANRPSMGTKNARGEYDWVTYREVRERVENLRGGLASVGVGRGDVVGIIADNRVEWAVACYATYSRGAWFVPMYEAELPGIWKYIIEDAGVKVLFVSSRSIHEQVVPYVKDIETLERVVLIDAPDAAEGTLAHLEAVGREQPVEPTIPAADDIAGLIYTSGTTGSPKGVLLSHGNLTSNVHAIRKAYHMLDENTRTLSFLPWAHSYGQTAELHFGMWLGASSGFAETPQTIVDDLAAVRPTLLVAVPRIFNRVYDGLHTRMEEQGGVAQQLFEMGKAAAARKRELAERGKSNPLLNLKVAMADRLVFRKIREKFGGRLRFAISSSAALSPHIARFFFDIGVPVYEAWGMTELSPAGTVNTPEAYKPSSGGRPLDKVSLVIDRSVSEEGARDGELIVYGPNVMQGYHNQPEATREVLTEDGGLRTGDRAYVDDDGFLWITGRIKEQFKLENGKFVFPGALEEEIKLLPLVEHVMIHGLNRPYTVALVVPDFEVLAKQAHARGWSTEPERLVQNPEVQRLYEREITKHLQKKFGGYEIPKRILLLSEPFTTENGILTPTLKLKRRKVLDRYQDAVEQLYQ
jgi:long-chain acyl-CoA synthetase